jgi:hypothetical protein
MRMEIAAIYFQFPINGAAKFGVRNHPANRALDEQLRMTRPPCFDVLRFVATHETGKAHESFLVFLLAGEPHFFGVDDDDEITGIDVRRVDRLFFAAQQIGGFHGDATQDLVLGVNDPPFAWNFGGFCGKRFHREREGTESMVEAGGCQQDVRRQFAR